MKKLLLAFIVSGIFVKLLYASPSYLPVQIEICNASPTPTCLPWNNDRGLPVIVSTPVPTNTPGTNVFSACVSLTTPVVLVAAVASTFNDLTGFTVTNNSSVTVGITLVNGAVTIWGPHTLPALYGGAVVNYPVPEPTANAGTSIILSNAVTSVCISGVYNARK